MSDFDVPSSDLESLPVDFDENDESILRRRIREWVCRAVWIAERRADMKALEPTFASMLHLMQSAPQHAEASENELLRYLGRLDETFADEVLANLIAYLMATLRYPRVLEEATRLREAAQSRYDGGVLSAWTAIRLFDCVIGAYSDDWQDAEFYEQYPPAPR